MFSYPMSQEVFDDLGEKALAAFTTCVARSRHDLAEYRRGTPQWVADHSERGLANWISDRLWAHTIEQAEGVPEMRTIETGVTREVKIGKYRIRLKRHDEVGNVSSYPTQTFLEFARQPTAQLRGMEETHLIVGYEWIPEERGIGQAVMSMRDGRDNIIWFVPLPDVGQKAGDGGADIVTPVVPKPAAPVIDVPSDIGQAPEVPAEGE